jgi:arylsulfatase A-like enzyme
VSAQGANSKPAGPLNVVLISIDSLRADMPWAGYSRPIAPRLTELEKKAVSYTRAYSVSSYTSMSLGGLLGGKIPSGLVRSGYFFGFYPASNLMFPELLQKAGVYTMGVHAHFYFHKAGMEQGFDRWEVVPGISTDNTTDKNITSPQSLELAVKALSDERLKKQPFFFWAHFLDPHDVYMKHAEVTPYGKSERDKYDGEVTYTDEYVGKLVDFVQKQPWASRTAIIVTSDHGEAFGEHKMSRHGFEVWEPLVRVPLFILAPGAKARRIDVARSAIDLAPTILELTGAPAEASFEGKSLVKELYGAPPEARDIVVDLPATSDNDRRRALIHGDDKLICSGNDSNCRLFDLKADATEDKPIARGDTFKAMSALYKAHSKTITEQRPTRCRARCLNGAYARDELF